MASEYEVRIYNRSGALQYVLVPRNGLLELGYTRRVNQVGIATFTVEANNIAIASLEKDWQVRILRADRVAGIDWYTDFYGLFRVSTLQTDGRGITRYTAQFADGNHWLSRAIVGYNAGVNNRTSFNAVAAETIAKTLVTRNATSGGTTADGRVRNVDSWGANISVESDGATGETLSYTCAYRNLLQALQEVAALGGGDFEMVQTGATAWQFRWHHGQLGTDRTASVVFSPSLNNMANPVLLRGRMDEATVAIVGGQDTGTNRDIDIVTADAFNASYHSAEMFIDARDQSTGNLETRGASRLEQQRSRDELRFDVMQVFGTLYGKHYFLGDLVTASYGGVTATKQVHSVTVTYQARSSNPEEIQIGLRDL